MLKKSLYVVTIFSLFYSSSVFAFQPKTTSQYFNGPIVSSIGTTSATIFLSDNVINGFTSEEKSGVYFKVYETHQVCIMIYPTPEYCLPRKTTVGSTSVMLTNLKPNTSYTASYVRDNTIRCITTQCPDNSFESLSVEFMTKPQATQPPIIIVPQVTTNLRMGSYGQQVIALQTILTQYGYFSHKITGYFGNLTLKAVKQFQRDNGITPTGFVGSLTRKALLSNVELAQGSEIFEGKITAYSTSCFSDGECSITIDGKKVITTIGWSQEIVGRVTGIPDFGSLENKIGSYAKVYAKKVPTGYTLYGNTSYYVAVR